jgi:hypothetical protein
MKIYVYLDRGEKVVVILNSGVCICIICIYNVKYVYVCIFKNVWFLIHGFVYVYMYL